MDYIKETTVKVNGRTFKLQVIEDIDHLLELVKTDDDIPFWAVLWPAAIGMAEYFLENIDFKGSNVLELGAGLGLAGIVAAEKDGKVIQTDFVYEAVQLAKENAKLNGISNIENRVMDWRDFNISDEFDWIIGSDILYEPDLHPFLKNIFINNLSPGGTIVLSDPGRENAKNFIAEMVEEGYRVETVEKNVAESNRTVKVKIYFLKNNL